MGIGIAFVSALRAKVPTVVIDKDKSQVEKQFKFLGMEFIAAFLINTIILDTV